MPQPCSVRRVNRSWRDTFRSSESASDRSAIARVELGQRTLSLDEAFLYALALDVAPVHLFAPPGNEGDVIDKDERLNLGATGRGPRVECSAVEMRRWIRGEAPMYPPQNPRAYFTEVPLEEFEGPRGWRAAAEEWGRRTETPEEEQ